MYLSISSYSWLPSSFLNKLSLLHNYGIEALEIFCSKRHLNITDPEEVQRAGMAIRELGFRKVSMHAPSSVGDLSNPQEKNREETLLSCQKALDAALLMGATLITFHPTSIDSEIEQAEERWVALQETLRDLSGYAEDRDVKIAIENFPISYFGGNTRDLYQRIAEIDLPNIGMCLDIGRAHVSGDLPAVLKEFGEKIFSVHASDNRGHADEHLIPGEGIVPWEEILDGLRQLDFRGPFVVEVRQERTTEDIIESVLNFADQMGLSGIGQLSH